MIPLSRNTKEGQNGNSVIGVPYLQGKRNSTAD